MHHVPHILEAAAVGFATPGGGPEQLHIFVVLAPGGEGEGNLSEGKRDAQLSGMK